MNSCPNYLAFIWQQLAQLPQFPRPKTETISWFNFFNHVCYRPVDRGGQTVFRELGLPTYTQASTCSNTSVKTATLSNHREHMLYNKWEWQNIIFDRKHFWRRENLFAHVWRKIQQHWIAEKMIHHFVDFLLCCCRHFHVQILLVIINFLLDLLHMLNNLKQYIYLICMWHQGGNLLGL